MTPILVNKDNLYRFINKHPILINELKMVLEKIPVYYPEVLNVIVKLREVDDNAYSNHTDYDDLWVHVIVPEDIILLNEKSRLFYTDFLAESYMKTGGLFRVECYFPKSQEEILK